MNITLEGSLDRKHKVSLANESTMRDLKNSIEQNFKGFSTAMNGYAIYFNGGKKIEKESDTKALSALGISDGATIKVSMYR